MAFRTIGKALPRIEGEGKVTGQTKYAADLPFEDLLWAKVLRASVPHARIVKVDTSKAAALKGVRAVLTGADVKDIFVGTRVKDQPVLAYDKVRMVAAMRLRRWRLRAEADRRRGDRTDRCPI